MSKTKKTNKLISTERKLNVGNFEVKIGSVNKKMPQTFYIESSTYITPQTEIGLSKIQETNRLLKEQIKLMVDNSNTLGDIYHVDIDIASKRAKINKKTRLCFSCYFYQKNKVKPIEEIDITNDFKFDSMLGYIEKKFVGCVVNKKDSLD